MTLPAIDNQTSSLPQVIAMKAPIVLAAGLLMLASNTVYSEVYRHVDAYGNVTYSDEPMEGGEEVQVKPVTTITLPKPEVVQEPEQLRERVEREGAAYQSVSFQYPANEQAFHSGNGNVTFEVQSTPPLDRKSTRLNSSHVRISYAVFCLK